jgi:hypothetical protein
MVHLAANIYRKLTLAQKFKFVEIGVLPPDFENMLLDVFNEYLAEKQERPGYYKSRGLLLQINPEEFTAVRNNLMLSRLESEN